MTKTPVAFGKKTFQQHFKDTENTLNMQVNIYIKIEERPGSPPLTP